MNAAEKLHVGDVIVAAEFGPLTIIDTVRWAGVQENSERIHFDREFARENSRLRTFIASGGYRQALLARALTDRIGLRGKLLKLRVRHVAPTFEGDMLRCSARVTEKVRRDDGTAICCEVEGKNQKDEQVLIGSCVLLVP
jgi:acyl dehydratase